MSIEEIKQNDLTPSERDVLKDDSKRWKHMGGGGHLDEWLAFGPGLLIRRRVAMKMAYVNRPEGKGYNIAFGELLEADGLGTMEKTAISNILWLHDDPERMTILREIRDAMTAGERSRLNSPLAARQRVEKILKARAGGTEDKLKTSPVTNLKRQIAEQDRKIADLEKRLAAADDSSLFDLRRDTVADIVRVFTNPMAVNEHKATSIARGILDAFKKRSTPAG